jgi:hypothetical protein
MIGTAVRAVSVNLGGGGPTAPEYRQPAIDWAADHIGAYDLVLAQEVPGEEWIAVWSRQGFVPFESDGPTYRPRSVVLVRDGIDARPLTAAEFPTAAYHGSYVAAAGIELAGIGRVVLMSVHASPNRVSEAWAKNWKDCDQDLPDGRPSCGLWDADLVLRSVELTAASGVPVIAAGDWNEARDWDRDHPGEAGAEFFAKVGAAGLTDRCCPAGRDGAPTHRGPDGRELCIDHVFTTATAPHVEVRPPAEPVVFGPADHRPVEFTIGTPGGV